MLKAIDHPDSDDENIKTQKLLSNSKYF